MKSVTLVISTPYVASDLREFVEALRKISLGSLYFHVFESRLRLGRGLNDFPIWLQDSSKETELGEEIARLDPYTYTLEGLRSAFIQLIEKRIQQVLMTTSLIIGRSTLEELRLLAARLTGKVIQNINSTFSGGGVAEMLGPGS